MYIPILESTFAIIAMAMVGFFVYYKVHYPVKIINFEERGNGHILDFAVGRRTKFKDGATVYDTKKGLFSKVQMTKPQKFENIYMTKKGGSILMLYKPSPDQSFPMKFKLGKEEIDIDVEALKEFLLKQDKFKHLKKEIEGIDESIKIIVDKPSIEVINEDLDMWNRLTAEKARLRFQDKGFMDKYGGLILIMITGVMVALIFYTGVGQLQQVSGPLSSAASSISNSLAGFTEALKGAGGSVAGALKPV